MLALVCLQTWTCANLGLFSLQSIPHVPHALLHVGGTEGMRYWPMQVVPRSISQVIMKVDVVVAVVQWLSCVQLSTAPWIAVRQAPCPSQSPWEAPCPSQSPWVCSNSCPLNQWCHSTTLSSVILFPFCPQSFPASGSFPVSPFFTYFAKVLELQLQHQSFQWIFRIDFL